MQNNMQATIAAPRILAVVLDNGDAAMFVNGEVVYATDAHDECAPAAHLAQTTADAIGVECVRVEHPVPEREGWTWTYVYSLVKELTPTGQFLASVGMMIAPAGADGAAWRVYAPEGVEMTDPTAVYLTHARAQDAALAIAVAHAKATHDVSDSFWDGCTAAQQQKMMREALSVVPSF